MGELNEKLSKLKLSTEEPEVFLNHNSRNDSSNGKEVHAVNNLLKGLAISNRPRFVSSYRIKRYCNCVYRRRNMGTPRVVDVNAPDMYSLSKPKLEIQLKYATNIYHCRVVSSARFLCSRIISILKEDIIP